LNRKETMVSAEELYENYGQSIFAIISLIKDQRAAAIPQIVAKITTEVLPNMMHDVGAMRELSGSEKRQLIIDAIKIALKEGFEELNKIPELAAATWDETLRDYLLVLIPPTIKLLVDVEKKNIMFNKKVKGCFGCCLGH